MITIKSNSLALGYYPDFFTEQQYFQPDDLGFIDEQGYLNVVGRSSNKIITGGENVFPAEVEAAIQSTQLVSDVCVTGVPDSYWGQVVIATYVPRNEAGSPELLAIAIKDKLSRYKQPKYWMKVASLPRNHQGKMNYEQLQKIVNTWLSCCAFKTDNLISRFGDWGLGTGDWEDPELPLPQLPTPNSQLPEA
jgi:O-succinylbenzoic acid--CoA ligase